MGKVKHGYGTKNHPLYWIYKRWASMIARCCNPAKPAYPDYGGRGIFVCKEWRSFETFLQDMGVPESRDMSIERIDNNGPYAPWNCKWETLVGQANNRRNNRVVTCGSESKTLAQWARVTGIDERCLFDRIVRYGWDVNRALTEKIGAKGIGVSRKSHTCTGRETKRSLQQSNLVAGKAGAAP